MSTAKADAGYNRLLVAMSPRVIRTAMQHKTYLRRVEHLMQRVRPSRARDEMIELLSTLIEDYESQKFPPPQLSAGELLAEALESRRLSLKALAAASGVPQSTLSNVIAGRRGVSKANALKLSKFLRLPVEAFFAARS